MKVPWPCRSSFSHSLTYSWPSFNPNGIIFELTIRHTSRKVNQIKQYHFRYLLWPCIVPIITEKLTANCLRHCLVCSKCCCLYFSLWPCCLLLVGFIGFLSFYLAAQDPPQRPNLPGQVIHVDRVVDGTEVPLIPFKGGHISFRGYGSIGRVQSMAGAANHWKRVNGIPKEQPLEEFEFPDVNQDDDSRVIRRSWRDQTAMTLSSMRSMPAAIPCRRVGCHYLLCLLEQQTKISTPSMKSGISFSARTTERTLRKKNSHYKPYFPRNRYVW